MSTTSSNLLRHDDPQLFLSPPILTKMTSRSDIAIIKLDKIAVTHLRTAGPLHPFHRHYYHWATTGPLDLQHRERPPLRATVTIYSNGCSKQENNRFLSIFVEIKAPNHEPLPTPFNVKLFFKNFF